ncbi:hypothetical protein [Proteus sp. CD3]|uniref:hypothetical protein n=1 Tax=Proteus sp. CD3 TaxID=1921565 RepID=UPI001249DAD6|nr:hypothetical protein [Proteus sp. CD3]QEZ91876.1 hypothetical protein BTA34_05740 [Proteus sp. CD3]
MEHFIRNTSKNKELTIESVERAEEWLKTLGINFSNSRFGNAKKILNQINQQVIQPNLDNLWAMNELYELVQLCDSFSSSKEIEDAFIERITGGVNFLCNEKKSSARDLFFEAKAASRLKRGGCEIIKDKSHDIVFKKNAIIFGAECKRPSNDNKLINHIKYAYNRQLNKLSNRNEQGVIFIDLDRILYKKFSEQLLHSDSSLPFSDSDLLAKFRNDTDIKYKNLIQRKIPEIAHGVLMIIVHYSFPIIIQSEIGFRCLMFNHYCLISSSYSESVELISSGLRDSVGEGLF